ncbi:hypothetical protein ACO0LC_28455 [Undibacterium sp. JH2W]|uniref:hypothetical protein n=1 Tax=Undibacterium sp. JH2W TaxID=3413037 RepID=UPI003BF3DF6C
MQQIAYCKHINADCTCEAGQSACSSICARAVRYYAPYWSTSFFKLRHVDQFDIDFMQKIF